MAENGPVLQRGFQESVVCGKWGTFSGVRVSGPVILYASSMLLFVEESNRLENVIIVEIELSLPMASLGEFGCLARDATILLGNQKKYV